MYRYQCSKQECGSFWSLHEGNLNGFVLTCPVCGKGRGLFVSQTQREIDKFKHENIEEIIISVSSSSGMTSEDVSKAIDRFTGLNALTVVKKDMESNGKEIICKLLYKKEV